MNLSPKLLDVAHKKLFTKPSIFIWVQYIVVDCLLVHNMSNFLLDTPYTQSYSRHSDSEILRLMKNVSRF